MRAGLENVEVLKVDVMDLNNCGAARDEKSWQTRRKFERSSGSKCSRRLSRQLSFSQNRRKTELVERTKLQMELFERVACECQQGSAAQCARESYIVHQWSSRVSMGFRQTTTSSSRATLLCSRSHSCSGSHPSKIASATADWVAVST